MGNSCLEYRGVCKFVPDFEIEVVANAILHNLDQINANYIFENLWKQVLDNPTNGGINLQLDNCFPLPSDGLNLIDLIQDAKINFTSQNFISAEEFNRIFPYQIKMEKGGLEAEIVRLYFDKIANFMSEAIFT